jgi:hypothetical protein
MKTVSFYLNFPMLAGDARRKPPLARQIFSVHRDPICFDLDGVFWLSDCFGYQQGPCENRELCGTDLNKCFLDFLCSCSFRNT